MSLALFAKRQSIRVDYASESIFLEKDGLMTIVVDLLITNNDNNAISKLYCIVPYRIIYSSSNRLPSKYKNDSLFEDITEDIINKNSLYGGIYDESNRLSSYMLNIDGIGKKIIRLAMTDPRNISENILYSGDLIEGSKITPCDDLTDVQHTILSRLNISVFNISLPTPVISNEARWFRWKFLTLSGSRQIRDRALYIYDYFRNKLDYNYAILGPDNVINYVKDSLDAFGKSIETYSKEYGKDLGELYDSYKDMDKKLIVENIAISKNSVSINDWRVRIFNRSLEPLSSIQMEGDVSIVGGQPNYIYDHIHNNNEILDVYYEWKTGKIHSLTNMDNGIFVIRFLTKYQPRFHNCLVYIAFILALLSLLISLFFKL